ncbi:MAG: hypothetical protein ACI35M_03185 [Alistipes sp.]
MIRYIIRCVKYFAALSVLYAVLIAIMHATGQTVLTMGDTWNMLVGTSRGWTMIGAMVFLAVIYPLISFPTRRVEGDMVENREQIMAAFGAYGYSLQSEADGRLTFRADGLRRLWLLYEDKIVVEQYGQWIRLTGIRRSVVRIAMRLDSYITNLNRKHE